MSKQALIEELTGVLSSVVPASLASGIIAEVVDKHLEGMVIVPEEPTEEMIEAAIKATSNPNLLRGNVCGWGYKAMLQAHKEST